MAEKVEALAGTTDAEHAATEIAYCPHLGLYHYKRADGLEEFFNRERLEIVIENYLKQGELRLAEYMSILTGHARRYPHVFLTILPDGRLGMRKMEIPEDERNSGIIEDSPDPTIVK